MNTNTNKIYFSAKGVADMLDISVSSAYNLIRKMNAELQQSGFLTLQGKVPRAYFCEKWYGLDT